MSKKIAAAFAAALALALFAPAARAQKALVYCPVGVDATGCDRIVAALQPKFPDGVDRGYDGTNSTVDLMKVDLEHYAVIVVPSLADDDTKQPYTVLRKAAARLHLAVNGRVAVYSGAPDQGSANRSDKDAIIQNLATWSAKGHTRATGLVGLVAFLDLSENASARYSWVKSVSLADVSADAETQSIADLTPSGRGGDLLANAGQAIRFSNMASYGLHIGARAAARTEVGAMSTATDSHQSVLVTYANADGKDLGSTGGRPGGASFDVSGGGGSGPTLTTDKPDYLPGDTVLFSGTGWAPNDTVTITVHEDPQWSNPDRTVTAVADGNGNLSSHTFVVDQRDYGVTFTATAVGNPSGLVAQVAFTDGNIALAPIDIRTVNPGPLCSNTSASTFANGSSVCADVKVTVQGGGTVDFDVQWYLSANSTSTHDTPFSSVSNNAEVTDIYVPAVGSWTVKVCKNPSPGGGCNGGNVVSSAQFTVNPNTPPAAANDTYSTNEDAALTIAAPGVLSNDSDADHNPLTAVLQNGPAHGTLALNANGSFTYTPNANYNGPDSFTYFANDGSANSNSAATVSITVNAVNDAPSFTKGADQTALEDAAAQSIANWATAISAGPADESAQTLNFVVSNDNNALFTVQPAVAANGTLTYTLAANANGLANVTLHIHDNGGTANGGVDVSADQVFKINVTAVNDAPSFTKGANQTVLEDAGAQTASGWATAISAGPPDEATQTLTFVVTSNSNPGLFSAGPAISASGNLTYMPAANANGSATIKVKLTDNGGVLNGGVDASAEQTFVVNVTAVNDAPSFTKGTDPTVNEDAGAQTVAGWAMAISAGPPDEAGQVLTFNITNNTNAALFSVQPSVAANGTLTYTPAPNANGVATITLTLSDNGGTLNGGVDTSAPQSFVVTVNAVNDVPSFTKGADQTALEDASAQSVTGWATAISAGPANESSQLIDFIVTNDNNALFSSQPAVDASGKLTYTSAPNANGSANVSVKIHDNGGTAFGGVDTSVPQTFTITVTAVNDAPTFTKGANQSALEDVGPQTAANWATAISAGPPDESGQTLTFQVSNDNNALFSVQPSIDATGKLTYTAAPDANGVANVTVTLKDNGGTANGGVDTSGPQMFTITITPVNDVPSFTKGPDQTKLEDAGPQSVSGWATGISAGPANESSQTLNFIVTNDNNGLFSSQPAVDASGKLTYTTAANANGSATVSVQIHDNGGTANGGVDTSPTQTFTITITAVNDAPSFTKGPDQTKLEDAGAQTVNGWATAISAGPPDETGQTVMFQVSNDNNALFSVQPSIDALGNLTFTAGPNANGAATVTVTLKDNGGTANGGVDTSAPQMFTITITPVNDPPSFTKGADQDVLEDAGPKTIANWATAISPGPANESAQVVSFHITGNTNPSLFSSGPAISSNGTLTYTGAPDAFGTATITVAAQDDGGILNGGQDTSPSQTFVITIEPVNDAPTFNLIASHTVLEDAGPQSVASALTNPSPGPANESGQTLSITVTNNNNALFSSQPSIDLSTGTLTYTAAANANGTATVTVTVMDNGGTANGGVDHTTKMLTITVTPVNDAPSFTKGADQTTLEDAGAQTVSGWAASISAGPPDEAGQALNFIVTNDNNALFSSQPAVSPTGQLTYTAAPNANGVAHLTIKLHDDGGILNGGADTSPDQTFTINITPVNDAPTFDLIGNQTVLEDAGAQTVANAVTNKSPGPPNESGQTLTLTVTNDNSALFSVQPAIDGSGTLTYTSAPNANGSTTVTVKLQDNGGTANGGVDLTTKIFTITVTPVNDAPSFTKGADQTTLEDAGAQTVATWATAISAGPPDEAGQALNFIVTNDNNALFSSQPAVSPTGQLTYTAAPNANGVAHLTIKLHDDGGVLNGGVDTSPDQTFTITITPVNDAPSFTKGADQTKLEDAGAQTVANWATAISAGPPDEAAQLVDFVVSNSNNSLFSVQPAVAADGTLTYTPAPDAFGVATVTVHAHDNGGTANGGVNVSADQTLTITIKPVNDAPSFTKGADQTKLEDAGAQTVVAWATNLSKGPPNESGQTLTFALTNTNNGLFSSQPAIDASGKLTYTPAANANGAATVTVVLSDDGGTTDGGVDTAPSQMFTITITAVNDAPTFDLIGNQTVLEDAGAQSVASALTNPSPGPANESGQTLSIGVTNDNNGLFSAQPSIDLLTGILTYTPAANANGSAIVTVTVSDNGGVANGGADHTTKTFTITVTAVNDAPSFTKGANQTTLEDAGAQTVSGWATAISAGPTDESGQTLNFIVTNDNNSLFSTQPAISATGQLTYTAAPNQNGSANVTVKLHDNGGIANGGVDTSPDQTFTITITAVNDAPTFNVIGNQSVLEDAGLQTVLNAVTNKSPGPLNESSQTLTLTVTNNNNGLFSVQPAIDASGTLTYTSALNANGVATVTVKLQDNGGTANGGVDLTTKTFMITVTPVNDPPVITAFAGPLAPNAVNTSVSASGTFQDPDLGDTPPDTYTGTIDWGDGNTTAVTIAAGSGTTRSFNGSHSYSAAGVYTVVAHIKDFGGLTSDATYQYVVVYDPGAGFVTGGGWINSPAGAYAPDPTLTGKATFGFVSKYKKGQSTPDGDTEFQFHEGNLNFKSTAYDWLVIAGSKAQYKGSGTINGSGDYGFMLTAIDGDLKSKGSPDTFRIKIWDKVTGNTVYDNLMNAPDTTDPTTTLGGGSIQIHQSP